MLRIFLSADSSQQLLSHDDLPVIRKILNDPSMDRLRMENNNSVRQAIISNFEAPRLQAVSLRHVVEFRTLREINEQRIEEKNNEPGTDIVPMSYRASFFEVDLKIFIAAQWVMASSVDEITEEQIISVVAENCKIKETGEQLSLIEEAVKRVEMKMHICNAQDRVWTFQRLYLWKLEMPGFKDIPYSKPRIATRHILFRINHPT